MMRPLLVCFQGKKKVHPQYDGQVSLKCKLNRLFVNYNAEICYSIISKLAWTPRAAFP